MDDTGSKSSFLLALGSQLLIIYKRLDFSLTMKIITFSFLFVYMTNLYTINLYIFYTIILFHHPYTTWIYMKLISNLQTCLKPIQPVHLNISST